MKRMFLLLAAALPALAPLRAASPAASSKGPVKAAPASIGSLIDARAVLLIDARSGKVLFSRNPDAAYPPASTVKLLTGLVAYEKTGMKGSFKVAASDTQAEPSHVPLRAGETVGVNDMVHAVLIGSRNDAALALGRHVAGSNSAFVDLMNRRAREMGCARTVLKNPHGLPASGQVSTCNDLMKIFRKVLSIPALRRICAMKSATITTASGRHCITNHNLLLGVYPGMGPAKTGWTIASRHTYAASASRGGRELLLTLLNSPNKWRDARILFDWGFSQ